MSGIVLQQFGGIAPKIAPRQLADNLAKSCASARFDRRRLEPWKSILDIAAAPSDVKTIYQYLGAWVTSTTRDQVVGSILSNDVLDRIFITDDDYPKIRSGASVYRLGLPAPNSVPTVVVNNAGNQEDPLDVITVSYVCTLVDAWGAEGPPSLASLSYDVGTGFQTTVTLPTIPSPPNGAGNWNLGPGSLMRIYRSNSGSNGAEYQFLAEVALGTSTYVDTKTADALGELLPSADWIGPPNDDASLYPLGPMKGLIEIPGGTLAGFVGNTVCVSEPYLPNAWPLQYRFSASGEVVGLVATSRGILVMTEDKPHLIVGHEPAAMIITPIESHQACVSAESIVDMGEFAMYASPDGLVVFDGQTAQLASKEYIDRDTWQATYDPSTIRASLYEGMYVAYYGPVANDTGFVFDAAGGAEGLMPISGKVDCFWYDALNDQLYVGYNQSGATWRIGEFNAGALATYTWRSKEFTTPRVVNFSAARVQADAYPVTLRIYADGVLKDTVAVASDRAFRLSGGYKAKQWEIELEGAQDIDFAGIWETMGEVV